MSHWKAERTLRLFRFPVCHARAESAYILPVFSVPDDSGPPFPDRRAAGMAHLHQKREKAGTFHGASFFIRYFRNQYMPPMSGAAGAGAAGSFLSATRLSVVRTIEATEAAFCRAERFTLVGSTMPLAIISP